MQGDKFAELLQSVRDMGKHMRGERVKGVRETEVTIKAVRNRTRLSQNQFAALIDVPVKTLQNWEQQRVTPTGPASALIHAIARDPEHVIPALQGRTHRAAHVYDRRGRAEMTSRKSSSTRGGATK